MRTIHLKIRRQNSPQEKPYWEEFAIPYQPNLNVVSALMLIQKNPVNSRGEKTSPVVWESNCLEEVCGACSMMINGQPRQACTALIDKLKQPVTLEPLAKFPVVRDLMVDREVLFSALKKIKAWIEIDGTYDLGPGPRQASDIQQVRYDLSRCMTCGVCASACPNFNSRTGFIGPAAVNQARLFNLHPSGAMNKQERLSALMVPGGIMECGNSQNCVHVCPKKMPLITSIARLKKEVTWHAVKTWLEE
ncbi:MAG: succinate dehydrogenase iron-sulfur subunit [Peptococcaceae bacterium]|jgi:succinate dehydrogenase / fumarate reductase iron-sulfur subunit|nr:succinate dehydrogenase iron-sulfur subunit [Peptococcaceae bacterium]MDH7526101.1 succinate dehydrogenase iron-sulfur subunit [Peptococcaceae bacterium]